MSTNILQTRNSALGDQINRLRIGRHGRHCKYQWLFAKEVHEKSIRFRKIGIIELSFMDTELAREI